MILEGDVTVEGGGQTVSFGPGDYVVFPKGLDCTWTVKKASVNIISSGRTV